jgi:hypothetical protein
VRRFRQSLLCHAALAGSLDLASHHVRNMHVSASSTLARAAAEGRPFGTEGDATGNTITEAVLLRPLLMWLLERFPHTAAPQEVAAWIARFCGSRALAPGLSTESMLLDACVVGTIELYVEAPAIDSAAGERPLAAASARWQARTRVGVTNLRHETMTLQDTVALDLLALLDGTRSRSELASQMRPALGPLGVAEGDARIDEYLRQFARYALLMPAPA